MRRYVNAPKVINGPIAHNKIISGGAKNDIVPKDVKPLIEFVNKANKSENGKTKSEFGKCKQSEIQQYIAKIILGR